MRIGLDFTSNVSEEQILTLKALCNMDDSNKYVVLKYTTRRNKKIEALAPAVSLFNDPEQQKPHWISKEVFMPFAMAGNDIDIFYSPVFSLSLRQPVKTVISIPDPGEIIFPDEKPRGIENRIRFFTKVSAAKKANRITTNSDFSKRCIASSLNIDPDKIHCTRNSVSKQFCPVYSEERIAGIKKKFNINSPYFICSVNFRKRDNLKEFLDIFTGFISQRNHCLLVMEGDLQEKQMLLLDRVQIKDRIIFAGKVENEDLSLLYNGAIAFISASLCEFDALAEQKAMSCGIPVITYNNSCFPEIIGHAGILIKDHDTHSFIMAMRDAKDNQNLRLKIRALSIQQANSNTAEKAAKSLLSVFERTFKEEYRPDEK